MKCYVSCGESNPNGLNEIVECSTFTEGAVIALSRGRYDKSALDTHVYVSERGFPAYRLAMEEEAYPPDGLFLDTRLIWGLTFPEVEL